MPDQTTSHRMPAIIPVHADGTRCTHRLTTTGNPLEGGCTGRDSYRATCSCGWEYEFPVKGSVAYTRDRHREDAIQRAVTGRA